MLQASDHLSVVAFLGADGQRGLLATFFRVDIWLYVNSFVYYALALLSVFLSPWQSIQLVVQLSLVMTGFGLLFLLRSLSLPRWNVFWGLAFFFHGAFFTGHLRFLVALPLMLFGMGWFIRWAVYGRTMAGIGLLGVACLLIPIDLASYCLFLLLVFVLAYKISESFSEFVGHCMIVSLSSILLLPWAFFFVWGKGGAWGWKRGTSTFLHPGIGRWEEILSLFSFAWLSRAGWLLVVIVGSLFALCALAVVGRKRRALPRRGAYGIGGTLLIVLLVILAGIPSSWHGLSFSLGPLLSLLLLLSCCAIFVEPSRWDGRILSALLVLLCLGEAGVGWYSFQQCDKKKKGVVKLLQRIPKRSVLYVSSSSKSRMPTERAIVRVEGSFMLERKGLAAVRWNSLGWTQIRPKTVGRSLMKARTPRAFLSQFAKRKRFLLLDGKKSSLSTQQRRRLILLGKAGTIRLYRAKR